LFRAVGWQPSLVAKSINNHIKEMTSVTKLVKPFTIEFTLGESSPAYFRFTIDVLVGRGLCRQFAASIK
jgi:hypothetical protein